MRVPAMVVCAEARNDDARGGVLFEIVDEGVFQAKWTADVVYLGEQRVRLVQQVVDIPMKAFWRPRQQPDGVQPAGRESL